MPESMMVASAFTCHTGYPQPCNGLWATQDLASFVPPYMFSCPLTSLKVPGMLCVALKWAF